MKRLAPLVFLALAASPAMAPAMAQTGSAPKVAVRLFSDHTGVAPGARFRVALEEKIPPGWHTYWVNPGDAGAPTEIKWILPPGWKAGDIQWPPPKRLPVGPLMDYGYEGTLWLITDVVAPDAAKPGTVTLNASVSWLVCKNICIPEDAKLSLPMKVGVPGFVPAVAGDLDDAEQGLPIESRWPMAYRRGATLDLFVAGTGRPVKAAFFPLAPSVVKNAAPQISGFTKDGLVLRLEPDGKMDAGPLQGVLVLTYAHELQQAVAINALPGAVPAADFPKSAPIAAPSTNADGLSLGLALLFALLGGLILNVMPCVLPVLAMKALALAQNGRDEARAEGLSYAAGAILSFLALGLAILLLRQGGAMIGWGFQLQDPRVVGGFALLIFAVGLNLSGVFELSPVTAGDGLTRHAGVAGAFFTGVLAVAVAAPCTAPFMALALGFALAGPTGEALGVFFALGLGFALPFLLLALWPAARRLLPRPGVWMLRLKEFLAFPMYAAAAWLVWVLAWQAGANGVAVLLGAMIGLSFAAWAWTVTRTGTHARRVVGGTAAFLFVLAALFDLAFLQSNASAAQQQIARPGREAYSAARLEALRAQNTPVFIDATAAWCITCLVNENAALSRGPVQAAFAAHHVVLLVADWTNRDAGVTALLQAQGRSGVPLYLYYAPGAVTPKILPQLLTENTVLAAIGAR